MQAAALIGVAVADFYPQFSLTGNLNYQSSLARDLLSGGNGVYSAGPSGQLADFFGRQHDFQPALAEGGDGRGLYHLSENRAGGVVRRGELPGGVCQGMGPSPGA